MTADERPGDVHRETAREAGLSRLSVISVIAGTLSAYGAFAVIAAAVGAALSQVDVDTDFESNNWTGSGAVASLASALVLLLAYLFGGYVAGRMARRAAILHGIAVFLLSLVLGAVIGAVAGLSEGDEITDNLRSIGVPTDSDQITNIAIVGAVLSLAAILVGAVLGAQLGERWHTKLARRAVDPSVGPAADARARAEREDRHRDERVGRDEVVRREVDRGGGDHDGGVPAAVPATPVPPSESAPSPTAAVSPPSAPDAPVTPVESRDLADVGPATADETVVPSSGDGPGHSARPRTEDPGPPRSP